MKGQPLEASLTVNPTQQPLRLCISHKGEHRAKVMCHPVTQLSVSTQRPGCLSLRLHLAWILLTRSQQAVSSQAWGHGNQKGLNYFSRNPEIILWKSGFLIILSPQK